MEIRKNFQQLSMTKKFKRNPLFAKRLIYEIENLNHVLSLSLQELDNNKLFDKQKREYEFINDLFSDFLQSLADIIPNQELVEFLRRQFKRSFAKEIKKVGGEKKVPQLTAQQWVKCLIAAINLVDMSEPLQEAILEGTSVPNQINSQWYARITQNQMLAKFDHKAARKKLIEILALANKNSAVRKRVCKEKMYYINSMIKLPLTPKEVSAIVNVVYLDSMTYAPNTSINLVINAYALPIPLQVGRNQHENRTHQKANMEKQPQTKSTSQNTWKMMKINLDEEAVSEKVMRINKLLTLVNEETTTLTPQQLIRGLGYDVKKVRIRDCQLEWLNTDSRINVTKVKGGNYKVKVIDLQNQIS